MTEETEQDIVKRLHKISTQIENLKATQFEAENLANVIKSEHARVRDGHSLKQLYEHCRTFYAPLTRVEEQLDYWETRFTQLAKAVKNCEHEYKAIVKNLEKVNAECETWKQRYQELNKKFDNGAVKFTDAKLKADAIAMSYDELSETLRAVEQERDKYKEKYEVTKKLLDAETSAEHTGSNSYNELYKENQQLCAALDEKEDQIDGLFKEAKLLSETKVSLVSELLDLKYLIHRLRLDDEISEISENVTNADNTNETES